MLKIYGSMLCPDCVTCCEELSRAEVAYTFLDFSEDLRNLKEFLAIRDTDPQLSDIRRDGKIGIPCILQDDGTVALQWDCYVTQDNA